MSNGGRDASTVAASFSIVANACGPFFAGGGRLCVEVQAVYPLDAAVDETIRLPIT